MLENNIDVISLLEKALKGEEQHELEEVGVVVRVGDGIARIHGLSNAAYNEVVVFDCGSRGIILDLDEHFVSAVLLDSSIPVVEGQTVRRTGTVFKVAVGDAQCGRVINASGQPLDGMGAIECSEARPIEREAPGIIARKSVNRPLETGITVVDALVPIGKGQRELLVGGRNSGKTAVAIDTILNQKGKDVVCIYVSIGHKQADTARLVDTLERHDAMSFTTIVAADAHDSALHQFFAPYVGCTIAEYFMDAGRDVLVVYDDLSNHAVAYRELSLLLRKPPGREAYPGDIFYVHSRLLERAGQLSDELGGGSMTALPIVQLQGDDLAAYIPTNLISITDGQIVFDTNLFNQGSRPAVNVGLSVSRVGGAAQTPVIKKMAGQLKLEIAQFEELQAFIQFGSELDKTSRERIERGHRAMELIKQGRYAPRDRAEQAFSLFLLQKGFLDKFGVDSLGDVTSKFISFMREMHGEIYQEIESAGALSEQSLSTLEHVAQEFCFAFSREHSGE